MLRLWLASGHMLLWLDVVKLARKASNSAVTRASYVNKKNIFRISMISKIFSKTLGHMELVLDSEFYCSIIS